MRCPLFLVTLHQKTIKLMMMRKKLLLLIALMPAMAFAQTYAVLWKQVQDAEDKDLPKTQIEVVGRIAAKAQKEKAYGQLLKATLKRLTLAAAIAPDSLTPVLQRIEMQEQKAASPALKAVYAAALCRIYRDGRTDADDAHEISRRYARRAMEQPGLLARTKAGEYEPFVVKGTDSSIFNDDLLSVIGYEVQDFSTLAGYYQQAGMRQAACLTSLEHLKQRRPAGNEELRKSAYLLSLDSLINAYGDLPEAGEVAIERYQYMLICRGVTVEDKIGYIHYALGKWGGWKRANVLRNEEKRLTAACFQARIAQHVTRPGVAQQVVLTELRNIRSLTMAVYRVAVDADTRLNPEDAGDYKKLKPLMRPLGDYTVTRHYGGLPDYQLHADSFLLPALPVGVYLVEFSTSPSTEMARSFYFVSDVMRLTEELPDRRQRHVVVNATTGQPIAGAQVRLTIGGYNGQDNKTVTLTCDAKGEAVYSYQEQVPWRAFAYTPDDKACPASGTYGRFYYYDDGRRVETVNVYTDRSIYRPGQTVRMAAVAYERNSVTDYRAVGGKKLTAQLRDTNNKLVGEQLLTTDGYGKCYADFVLPAGALNGRFRLRVGTGEAGFSVEEYKRPTFQVEFPKVSERYEAGDTLAVKGKASTYAGVPVQGAKVVYTVKRRVAFWWMAYSRYWSGGYVGKGMQEEIINTGETVTAADGTFTAEMPMTLPEGRETAHPMFYRFTVSADVTDAGGESHSGEMSVPLGSRPTVLTCDLPDKALKDSLKTVTFRQCNAAGQDLSTSLRYRIDGAEWQEGETGKPIRLGSWALKSGQHRVEAICGTDTLKQEVVVFGLDDRKPCVDTRDWFYVSSDQFPRDGQPVTVQVGSSDEDVHIVYTVISGNQLLESGTIDNNRTLENRKFTYKEEYGNGLLLTYAWVKQGQCYQHSAVIKRPLPDRELRMQWTTFRDRLTPGQKEEWTLKVVKPGGRPADAQLIATLYDKSLDQIMPHTWNFRLGSWLSQPHTGWRYTQWGSLYGSGRQAWKELPEQELSYNCFDNSLFSFYGYGRGWQFLGSSQAEPKLAAIRVRGAKPMAAKEAAIGAVGEQEELAASADMATAYSAAGNGAAEEMGAGSMDADGGQTGQVRENLNETAFFYPAAQTDGQGNVSLKFTLPESLTTWRFMGIAHTADMLTGMLEGEAVAKKDVMIQPNMPRFVRTGDKVQLSAKIFNTGEATAVGTARMQLIDPETETVVTEAAQPFNVAAGETGSVNFALQPDGNWPLLICRITAGGASFSDGEQHYLPVLPDRERVTVTVPFTQTAPGTHTVDIARLFPAGTKQQKLTVEYTNNPAWLVVQALPSVGSISDDNVIEQAAVYYANTIAALLIKQAPGIKAVFDRWRMEQGGETSLAGSLQKNEGLKDIVLNETPWVADADREAEQKSRMAGFFDETLIGHRLATAVGKLQKLQLPDGSWSWWQGMRGSFYMTVEVGRMLARLNAMAGKQQSTESMLGRAFGFMGKEIVKEVDRMKADAKKGVKPSFPGHHALQWLYICAIDGRKLPADVAAANAYLIGLMKKDIKQQTVYDKALSAIVLKHNGELARSREYVRSLKEYTVYTEEMGRYYDTPRAAYSWCDYKIPTEVMAIEAIHRITPGDQRTVEEMQRWLLQEKRTQAWDTPINSVNAVYAFLLGNNKALVAQEQAVLAIDGEPLELPQATAAIGYVKTAVNEPKGKVFTAGKTGTGTSWGAVYAQFMQNTQEVEQSGAGITVKREVFPVVPVHAAASRQMAENPSQPAVYNVGDRVRVRITIEAARDLDFVQVLDRRAACMEPVTQLSGFRNGAYCSPKDYSTNYYYDMLRKGKHVIETEYYIDRAGQYGTGTCTVQCAYAPEYRATAKSQTMTVK